MKGKARWIASWSTPVFYASPFSSQATALPSIKQERTLSRFTASRMSGQRGDQSCPFRVTVVCRRNPGAA